LSWEILSPLIILSAVLAFVVLERLYPYDRGEKILRAGFWMDLVGYTLLQSYVLALVIAQITRAIDSASGLSRLHLVSAWPLALQVAFFVVSHDLYIYCFHRLQHHSPVLWRLHEAHHSARSIDWLAGSRSHSLEILINQTIEFAPMLLLGARPDAILIKGAIGAVWGMYIHANLGVKTGKLQWIINGPEAHRWHHATDADAYNKNFATKLAIWDRLFGTAYIPEGRKPKSYGLTDVTFPDGYVAQHLFAFRPLESPALEGEEAVS
jgi:sterol desaturase/sphingolipid hydroxylase (fatty acid hydroxylase superfamily)